MPDELEHARTRLLHGHGAGYLDALRLGPAVAGELVYDCICRDPRWDRQVEQRAGYYAELLLDLDLPVEPLVEHVRATHDDVDGLELTLQVLAELAVRGQALARRALCRTVVCGELHVSACALGWLHGLDDRAPRPLIDENLVKSLVASLDDEALVEFVDHADTVDWWRWASLDARLTSALEKAGVAPPRPRPGPIEPTASMATRELLDIAEGRNASAVTAILTTHTGPREVALLIEAVRAQPTHRGYGGFVAARALGHQANPSLLDEAERVLRSAATAPRSVTRRVLYLRYLRELPGTLTLPMARRVFDESWSLANAAESVFARHAQPQDRERLEDAAQRALETDDLYRLCSVVEALGVIADVRSRGLLERVVRRIPYSYGRALALRALAETGQPGSAPHFEEALWDCESRSRQLACEHVDPTRPHLRTRLQRLADDPLEEEPVRAAARAASRTLR